MSQRPRWSLRGPDVRGCSPGPSRCLRCGRRAFPPLLGGSRFPFFTTAFRNTTTAFTSSHQTAAARPFIWHGAIFAARSPQRFCGRAGGRQGGTRRARDRSPAFLQLPFFFFTRISPCGRSGAETFPARSPASLGRVKQPFYGHHTPRASPPTPEQNLAALGTPPTRHSQQKQLRGGRERGLPPAAIGRRLSRSAMRLVSSARRAGRDYQRFREPGASRLGREVRVAMLRLRAGAAGGHTVRDLWLSSEIFWGNVCFKTSTGLEFLYLKVALVILFPYLSRV